MPVGTFGTLRNRPVPASAGLAAGTAVPSAGQCPVPASAGLAAGAAVPSVGPPGRTGLQFPVHSGTVCPVGLPTAVCV